MAFGGNTPTLTDALLVAGKLADGNRERALSGIKRLSLEEPVALAERFVALAVQRITATIWEMLDEYAQRPVYTVDDLIHAQPFEPEELIGVGGAGGLATQVGEALGWPVSIPEGAVVANAVGAAVARPTRSITLRADTSRKEVWFVEAGFKQEASTALSLAQTKKTASEWLLNETASWQGTDHETEVIWQEQFSLVRGFATTGKIINLAMQLKPGILSCVTAKGDK
jgi:N-methylhydantoinase A/oxoprolinase/acetone carboxylase beta subunit